MERQHHSSLAAGTQLTEDYREEVGHLLPFSAHSRSLGALFFLHLRCKRRLVVVFKIYPLVLLGLPIGGTLQDPVRREEVRPLINQEGGEP